MRLEYAPMKKLGLALSGGGFRASLYHLGLVRFLRDAGLLSQVTHIASVSGDMWIFTGHRLIMIDKEGLTGSKVTYHSVLYRSITQFSVETAGSFDADSELKIWVSGVGTPITNEFKRGTDVVGIQKYLAFCAFGAAIKKD